MSKFASIPLFSDLYCSMVVRLGLRMPDSRDVKRVYDWKPDKKRPIGRPRKRFRDQIKEITSREIDDFSVVEAMTQDRSEWRSFTQRLTTNR